MEGMNKLKLRKLLEQFFLEDIGEQDVTSDLIFPEEEQGEIVLSQRKAGYFAERMSFAPASGF